MISGLRMSQSSAPLKRSHGSLDSSKLRFSVARGRLGFIAGLLTNTDVFNTASVRPSPNSASGSMVLAGWSSISDGTPPIRVSTLSALFCIPRAVCVNSFSSFSRGGDVARLFRGGSRRPENEPVGVGGVSMSWSSNSGEDRSTSGDGDSSLLRSASASSVLEGVLDSAGEMMARCANCIVDGSGMGWCG